MGHFDEFLAEMEDLQKRMQERSKEVFRTGSAELFEANPNLVFFSWTQCTPYFNDGDECVFGVNDYLDLKFSDSPQSPTEENYLSEYDDREDATLESYGGRNRERKNALKNGVSEDNLKTADAAHDLVEAIPEEVMKAIFGDHARVTVYRDRVEVDEYEHD